MRTYESLRRPSRNLELHPGINFSSMDVGGDLGGLVFAVGSVVAVLVGLPWVAPWYLASMACGVGVAVAIFKWHERRPGH